ncbi:MAG: alginate export family protein [Fibrobacteria bacterium]
MKSITTVPIRTPAIAAVLTIFAGPIAAAPPGESPFAPPPPAAFGFSGQLRTRTEFDQKAVRDDDANKPFLNTFLRSRLAYSGAPFERTGIRLEIQDSRYMGSEPSVPATNPAAASVGNSKGMDLLQGYATLKEGPVTAALGRQKLSLGSGRFLSTLEWSATSRSFDGVSANYDAGPDNLTALAYLVRDSAEKAVDDHLLLTGLFYNRKLADGHQADAFMFYDQARLAGSYGGLSVRNYDLVYAGERLAGRLGQFVYEEEFIWQTGELSAGRNLTSAAFQLALRAGAVLGAHKVNAGLDIMSGDDDPSDDRATAYRASYYFAHAYFGWMDYFVVNPAYGVLDIRLDGDFACVRGPAGAARVQVKPQYHFFLPQNAPAAIDEPYGQEADLEIQITIHPKANIHFGGGIFLPGDGAVALAAAGLGPDQDYRPGYNLYVMPTFNF